MKSFTVITNTTVYRVRAKSHAHLTRSLRKAGLHWQSVTDDNEATRAAGLRWLRSRTRGRAPIRNRAGAAQ